MEFKKLPVEDEEILKGRKPLPPEATYLMDKYKGTGRYINPNLPDPKNPGHILPPKLQTMPLYEKMSPSSLEGWKAGDAISELWDIDKSTGTGTPRVEPEKAKLYFDAIMKRAKKAFPSVDSPSSLSPEMSGIEVLVDDPRYAQIGLSYDPSTGTVKKEYSQNKEAKSLSAIDDLESEYFVLQDSYKKLGQEIPLERKKEIQQKIIDMYKAHSKKFGGQI
jgi:hypothetical protein